MQLYKRRRAEGKYKSHLFQQIYTRSFLNIWFYAEKWDIGFVYIDRDG